MKKPQGTKEKIQEAKTSKQVDRLEKKALSFEQASPRTIRKIARAIKAKRKELRWSSNQLTVNELRARGGCALATPWCSGSYKDGFCLPTKALRCYLHVINVIIMVKSMQAVRNVMG